MHKEKQQFMTDHEGSPATRKLRRFEKASRRVTMLGVTIAALAAGGVSIAVASNDAAIPGALPIARVLENSVPRLVSLSRQLGSLPATQRLRVVLPLVLPHQAALNAYVASESNPHSVNYRRFLTPAQFGARFGAPVAEVSKVQSALAKLGLSVASPSVNRLYVSASGTVPQLESVFDTTLERFHMDLSGLLKLFTSENYFANVTDIRLPAALNGLVTGVVGLDDSNQPHPMIELPTPQQVAADRLHPQAGSPVGHDGGASPCIGAIAGGGYSAADLATAYNFNGMYAKGLLGQGMSAALVEFDDFHNSNLNAVKSCFKIATPVTRELVDGGTGGPPAEGEDEDMLDIVQLMTLVPKLAHLYVYEAPATGVAPQAVADGASEIDLYNKFVSQDIAPVLSSSWGNCEELDGTAYSDLYNDVTEEAAAQGQQIFMAAGDSGAVDCRGYPTPVAGSISAMQEASSPFVTGVGGTDLSVESTIYGLGIHHEQVWNDAGAGGGGESVVAPMPAYQANYLKAVGDVPPGAVKGTVSDPAPCGVTSGYCRMVPDISMEADPDAGGLVDRAPIPPDFATEGDVGAPGVLDYCATTNCSLLSELGLPISIPTLDTIGGWFPVGGTSGSAPQAAAATVLWDQQAKAEGLGDSIGFINPLLYRVASNATEYKADFHDITVGSNDAQYDSSDCATGCNPRHLYQSGPKYDIASGLGSPIVATLGSSLISAAAALDVTPAVESLYGYSKSSVSTSEAVAVTGGFRGHNYNARSSASWLHVRAGGKINSTLSWHVNPRHLKPGRYHATITISGPAGTRAKLNVSYLVTKPATVSVSPKALHFSEQAINTSGTVTTATCDSTVWDDGLEYEGAVGAYSETDPPAPPASTLATVKVRNSGPRGSVLHFAAFLISNTGSWLVQRLVPGTPTSFQDYPQQPLVPTVGTLASGKSESIEVQSIANGDALGGYPKMNQGTYPGEIYIKDLATGRLTKLPVTLKLGTGQGTPTIATNMRSIYVSLPTGASKTVDLVLSDSSHDCGYSYGLGSFASWLSIAPNIFSGTVGAQPATSAPATTTDTGQGNGFTPVTISAAGLAKGVYRSVITINSQNANYNPTRVPVTLRVN
jgi:pro-kumamolisin-like protein